MRASSAFGLAFSIVLLGACSRAASDAEPVQAVVAPVENPSVQRDAPVTPPGSTRSLGQPRLSTLVAEPSQVDSPGEDAEPPAATFSQYNGRAPGDAAVPRDIASIQRQPTDLAPFERAPVSDPSPLPRASLPRDVVDLGLNRPVTPPVRSNEGTAAPRRIASIQRAPSPIPRPIPGTPTPTLRPIQSVAAPSAPAAPSTIVAALPDPLPPSPVAPPPAPALPPQPVIAALQAPRLAVPGTLADFPATGLPVPRTVEQAVPIGTLPASLGVANLEAGEAALPIADTLEQSVADESGALSWTQAAALIRAGEVESTVDIGEFEVLMTMCSGRGVLTIQPTPTALADLEKPKVVCGKSASLTSQ